MMLEERKGEWTGRNYLYLSLSDKKDARGQAIGARKLKFCERGLKALGVSKGGVEGKGDRLLPSFDTFARRSPKMEES